MPNWLEVNKEMNNIGSQLGNYFKEKRAKEDAIQLLLLKTKLEQMSDPMKVAQAEMLNKVMSGGFNFGGQGQNAPASSSGEVVPMQGAYPESMDLGMFKMKFPKPAGIAQSEIANKIAENKAVEAQKGLPIETGGKLAMVKQAQTDIQDVRKMLFPDGTPNSFSRGRAFLSNLPGSRGHLWSGLIPQAMPFSEMGQKIYSRLQNAVAAKLRVETGAQANPSEVENILQRFGITSASNPKAAWDALDRLEQFMNTTINITDPSGRFKAAGNIGQSQTKSGLNFTYKKIGE